MLGIHSVTSLVRNSPEGTLLRFHNPKSLINGSIEQSLYVLKETSQLLRILYINDVLITSITTPILNLPRNFQLHTITPLLNLRNYNINHQPTLYGPYTVAPGGTTMVFGTAAATAAGAAGKAVAIK